MKLVASGLAERMVGSETLSRLSQTAEALPSRSEAFERTPFVPNVLADTILTRTDTWATSTCSGSGTEERIVGSGGHGI